VNRNDSGYGNLAAQFTWKFEKNDVFIY